MIGLLRAIVQWWQCCHCRPDNGAFAAATARSMQEVGMVSEKSAASAARPSIECPSGAQTRFRMGAAEGPERNRRAGPRYRTGDLNSKVLVGFSDPAQLEGELRCIGCGPVPGDVADRFVALK